MPGRELTDLQKVEGALIASLVSWVLIIAVGVVVFWNKLPSQSALTHVSFAVEEGAKMVIRRLLKIALAIFIIISLVFLMGMSWQFSLTLFVSGMLATCVCSFVLRVSTASHARCALATERGQLNGFENALYTGMIVGVTVLSPVVFWAAALCLGFQFDRICILAFGFGITVVNLIIHVGGVIFSKASEVANEKRTANQTFRLPGTFPCANVWLWVYSRDCALLDVCLWVFSRDCAFLDGGPCFVPSHHCLVSLSCGAVQKSSSKTTRATRRSPGPAVPAWPAPRSATRWSPPCASWRWSGRAWTRSWACPWTC